MTSKQKLFNYLQSQRIMSLTTMGEELWSAIVYYVVDDKFNLYFLSEPDTQHGKNIASGSIVSCAIYDSHQKVTDKKIGVQITGSSEQVNEVESVQWMLRMWHKQNPGFEAIINIENIVKKVIRGRIYKVIPKTIKFFNEELYGPEGFEIFKELSPSS